MTAPFVYGNVGRGSESGSRKSERRSDQESMGRTASNGAKVGASASLGGRKRSTGTTDVGAVVSKAKKAAASLCVILHAQRCRESPYRCTVKGCAEAKIVHLHIKTCKARGGEECPKRFQGCTQTRKLLNHYNQCRETRARQVGQNSASRSSARQQQPHACLVCSLMARHARNILEGGKAASPSPGKSRKIISSFTLSKQKNSPETTTVVIPAKLVRTPSNRAMPPPPSRRPPESKSDHSDQDESLFSTSLPSSSELMSREISAVAAAAAPPPVAGGSVLDPSMLGKSLDSTSTYMDRMSALLNATRADIARVQGELEDLPGTTGTTQKRRPRSESYDAGSGSKLRQQKSTAVPQDFVGQGNDPTLEVLLTSGDDHNSNPEYISRISRRRRSASLGVLVEGASRCATILEEGSHPNPSDIENEQAFPMED